MNLWTLKDWIRQQQFRFRGLFRKQKLEDEMAAEIQQHLQQEAQFHRESGLSPEDAGFAAQRQFGGIAQIKESCRDERGWVGLEEGWRDLKIALRQILKSPGFALIALLTIALGIGANTAIFSLFDAVVLRSLPVKDPRELALLSPGANAPTATVGPHSISYPLYRILRDNPSVFDGLLCHFRLFANVNVRGEIQRETVELVSGNYFDVLGVRPALGRLFTPDDDRQPGAHPLAVLSYDFWQNDFAGDVGVIGQTIHFNGQPLTIIGVSARGFKGVDLDSQPQIRVPMMMTAKLFPSMSWVGLENSGMRWVETFGRLKRGVSLSQAQAAIQPLYQSWLQSAIDAGAFGQVQPADKEKLLRSSLDVLSGAGGTSFIRRDWAMPLRALTGMAGLMLLFTCINVANLFIGRGIARRGEIAVRLSLGASRSRVVRQLCVESVLIAITGGIAGLWLATLATNSLATLLPVSTDTTPSLSVGLSGLVLFVSAGATAIVAVLCGLLPALLTTHVDLAPFLHQASARVLPRGRLRQGLLVTQVTLSVLMLFGSGLFVHSLRNLYSVAPGFDTNSVVAFGIDPVLNGDSRQRAEQIFNQIKERIESVSGVESVANGLVRLLGGTDVWQTGTAVDGLPPPADGNQLVCLNAVSPDYFRTLRIHFREGRDFRATDRAESPPVVIINQAFAHHFLGTVEPLGRRIWLSGPTGYRLTEIVGVAEDSHYNTIEGSSPAQIFVPYSQLFTVSGMNGYVRSSLPIDQVPAIIRAAVHAVDPALPIHALRTMSEQRDRALGTERVVALLATAFGILATVLAGIGLFGVLNYSVARRMPELGLRIALGSPGASVAWLVVREVALLSGLGVVIAIPIAWSLGRLIANQLHGISLGDPWAAASAALILTCAAAMATALPVRRALRVNPLVALKSE